MISYAVLALALLGSHAPAARVKSEVGAGEGTNFVGARGTVDGIYTIGSPRSASPGLVMSPGNECFPGIRAWWGKRILGVLNADRVPMLPAPGHYKHPMMETMELSSTLGNHHHRMFPCDDNVTGRPWYRKANVFLHATDGYIELAKMHSDWFQKYVTMAVTAYEYDIANVSAVTAAQGWRLVGVATDGGGQWQGGEQRLYLAQNSAMECLMSFQGTDEVKDIYVDANANKVGFCGLTEPDEKCGLFEECKVRNAGGSFVHEGFRDHLMRMVSSDSWQQDVKPKLGKCSKVYVAGHSLGAAMAEYFAVCVSRHPSSGTNGWEHYKYMEWKKETPMLMPRITG